MAHTLQSILKALGKDAEVSGGAVTVFRDGKHIAVTKYVEGKLEVTPEGEELLGNPTVTTDDGVEVIQAEKPAAKKPAAKKASGDTPVDLDSLDDLLGE